MMNIVALCLVLSSLVAAGIRSPPPDPVQIKHDDVIVKEGHLPVEIEYERDSGSTKVKISPKEKEVHADSSSTSAHAEAAEENIGQKGSAMGRVCDAFGKCKQKAEGAVEKSKEVLLGKAHEVKDKVGGVKAEGKQTAGEAEHAVGETLGNVADAATGKAHDVAYKIAEAKERMKRAAEDAAHKTSETMGEVTKEAIATGNTLQRDVRGNSTEYLLPLLPDSFIWVSGSLKLVGLSLAYGTAVWVTFISTYITADALSRQQFAVLQSKIYPVYFKVVAGGIGMALFSHCLSSEKGLSSIQALNLSVSLAIVLFNLKFMEPRANKLMFDTMKLEKEEGRGMERPTDEPSVVRNIDSLVAPLSGRSKSANASEYPAENPGAKAESSAAARSDMVKMSERMKRLNFYSSVLNVAVLVSLTVHVVNLGQMVHALI